MCFPLCSLVSTIVHGFMGRVGRKRRWSRRSGCSHLRYGHWVSVSHLMLLAEYSRVVFCCHPELVSYVGQSEVPAPIAGTTPFPIPTHTHTTHPTETKNNPRTPPLPPNPTLKNPSPLFFYLVHLSLTQQKAPLIFELFFDCQESPLLQPLSSPPRCTVVTLGTHRRRRRCTRNR